MLRFCLDQRSRVGREHMILNRLAENQRKGIPVAIPRGRGPFPLITLFEQPRLNILLRNPFDWQVIEMLADDLELDEKLVVMLRRVALFGVELGLFGKFAKRDGAASERLRELLAQQHFVFTLRQQRNGIASASALLPVPFSLGIGITNPPDPRARNTLYDSSCFLHTHANSLHAVLRLCRNCCSNSFTTVTQPPPHQHGALKRGSQTTRAARAILFGKQASICLGNNSNFEYF